MDFAFDFVGGLDLPGELADLPAWEEVECLEIDCGRCGRTTSRDYAGLCRVCFDRMAYSCGTSIGCGLGLAVVLAYGGEFASPSVTIEHLTACRDCRRFFLDLAELVRVADHEAEMRIPYATASQQST